MIFQSKGLSNGIHISNPEITIGNGATVEDRATIFRRACRFFSMFSKDEGRIVITTFAKHLMDRRLIPPP